MTWRRGESVSDAWTVPARRRGGGMGEERLSAELRVIRAALREHFEETGNRPCTLPDLAAALTARGLRLPVGPRDGTWWAEQRIRQAMGAPGFAPVGRAGGCRGGRQLWAMTGPKGLDELVTPPT